MSEDDYGNDDEVEYYAVRPNKTQIKREIAVLFKLGETLSALPAEKLDSFDLPENIRHSLNQAAHMPHTGARKRLLKYIAQQFHKMDVSAIKEKLSILQNKSAHAAREHHQIEHWRDRLVDEGDEAVTELFDEYPDMDLQHVRQLLRQIKKENSLGKPAKSSRLLYRFLKSVFQYDGSEEGGSES